MLLINDNGLINISIMFWLNLQKYTNTDNPYGDTHLLETFIWHKVRNTD